MIDHDDLRDDNPLASLVRSAAPDSFDSGFGDRVLTRLRSSSEPTLSTALERQFVRIVPLAAAAALILAGYNVWGARGTAASTIDAALNLPQVTIASAYASSSLYEIAPTTSETP